MIDIGILGSSVARIPNPLQLRLHILVLPSALVIFATYFLIFLFSSSGIREVRTVFPVSKSMVMRSSSRMAPVFFPFHRSRTSNIFRRPSHLSLLGRVSQLMYLIFLFSQTCAAMLRKSGSSSYSQVARPSPARFILRVLQCRFFLLI